MRRNSILNFDSCHGMARYLLVNATATLILTAAQPALAQTQQKSFASAEQASQALYDAVRNENNEAVQSILGSAELISSGSSDEDKLEREHFAKKYDEMHRLVREPDGSTVLYIGAENWPFPIPLAESNGQWRFDSASGSLEVVAREIGENETAAIEVCQSVSKMNAPDANANPRETVADDLVLQFARKIISSENTGSTNDSFSGYYFRLLKAKSGETLLVAYPAEYGTSGVMTFVLAQGGVYQRDLGPRTADLATKIQKKPAAKWKPVQWTEPN